MSDERSSPGLLASTGPDDRALRTKAVWRSWICPGAGFALLGRDKFALATCFASLGTLFSFAWLAIQPGAAAVWTVLAAVAVATALWLAEQLAVKRLGPRTPAPGFLVSGFLFASAATWLGAVIVLVLLLTRFGSLQLAGSGMSPTLEKGERVLYDKRVEPERLRRGAVILYKVPNGSAWGEPGWLVVSRVLAAPGDRLSIQSGRYLVNGRAAPPWRRRTGTRRLSRCRSHRMT
jgi:Signal peptidase, peptidase S26